MICAGGVFVVLLLSYLVYYFGKRKKLKQKEYELSVAYSDENLTKMEYDLAFYDEEIHKLLRQAEPASQVTIDEVIGQAGTPAEETVRKKTDDAIFTKIGNEGVEEITGNFKRD